MRLRKQAYPRSTGEAKRRRQKSSIMLGSRLGRTQGEPGHYLNTDKIEFLHTSCALIAALIEKGNEKG